MSSELFIDSRLRVLREPYRNYQEASYLKKVTLTKTDSCHTRRCTPELVFRSMGDFERKVTLDDFHQSLTATDPPAGLTHALAGLWWDAKGDWTRAHESAQQDEGIEGSWVHAYLHRKEGDQGNAAYWYSRAGKPVSREPLDLEWLNIVRSLLK